LPELNQDEFYIGYLPRAPQGMAKLLRRVVAAVLGSAMLVVLMLVFGQQRLPLSVFEFQQYREYQGLIRATPYPALLVQTEHSLTAYLLVAPGKHRAEVAAFDGQAVKLRGALIQRDGTQMLELVPDSLKVISAAAIPLPAKADLGIFTLVGEIVDSKCYLGVMNPGHTKPHRECAVRCISGGIPPMFVARDAQGNELKLLLTDPLGASVNQAILDKVAEPLEITGRVVREGTQYFLQADPVTYRRMRW
jgi:hypothetical protein